MLKIFSTKKQAPTHTQEDSELFTELDDADLLAIVGGADGIENNFASTGFMFSIGNLVVSGSSRVKLFNQNSDASDNS
ncbi:hypothetical protein [Nostoc sp. ChiVER01]|uniref:hypothetical protein n=1 Tax=Nostoc sp. ChiVER01 TaxID=3075382 RepID=UPI002AD56F47|nr:hypothetical protein [Nostoc sp. ChiVER01]MDZ8226303.1 hypothetical protein [Nostoc sp. ChiVER01]